jgi:membrane-bound lytic murein transglycosylase B
VRTRGGGALPAAEMSAALVSGAARHFLVYSNYDALLAYNCAHAYAVSVALLADRLSGSSAIVAGDGKRPPAGTKKPAARGSKRDRAARP